MLCREEQALLSWGKRLLKPSAWKLAAIGFITRISRIFDPIWRIFAKNHSEFGKYNVLEMCRVNDMAN